MGREDSGTSGRGTRGRGDVGTRGLGLGNAGDAGTWDAGLGDVINKQHLIFSLNLLITIFDALEKGINYAGEFVSSLVADDFQRPWFACLCYRESPGRPVHNSLNAGGFKPRGEPWRTFRVSNCVFFLSRCLLQENRCPKIKISFSFIPRMCRYFS